MKYLNNGSIAEYPIVAKVLEISPYTPNGAKSIIISTSFKLILFPSSNSFFIPAAFSPRSDNATPKRIANTII